MPSSTERKINVKTFFGVVLTATMLFLSSPKAGALFGHTAEERQRRIAAEYQVTQERRRTEAQQHLTTEERQRAARWQTTATILSVAVVVALIVGTAIGSKGRHHAATGK